MFHELFDKYRWDEVKRDIYGKQARDVERALGKGGRDLEDFKALVSPAAASYLEEMAQMSHRITQKRFGKVMQLYIPLYLSNECQNICTYCGFSLENKIARRTLSAGELLREAAAIGEMGYEHVLLVSGEANQLVGVEYFAKALDVLRPHFAQLSMEVQPLEAADYAGLVEHGLHGVLVYQETYCRADYALHHPKGRKANFLYRLGTPDRLGEAGVYKMGLGVLIGLEDWRTDSWFTGLHLRYLENRYWRTRYSLSFPRLRPFSGGLAPKVAMTDRELIQLICAYRLLDEEVELSLSTRESPVFRDHTVRLGVTSMSAGSRTNPGGYVVDEGSLEQFAVHDERSPAEIAAMIRRQGYDTVWKDWDAVFQAQ
jgi:2-iminoacetate synthase